MNHDWNKIIRSISPTAKDEIVKGLADAMPKVIEIAKLNSSNRIIDFLAQIAEESDGFRATAEYASGDAYDTRTDLGFTRARDGDGRKYKGFGLIQTTGPINQAEAAKALGIYKEWKENPRILTKFPYAALSAAIYWNSRNCNKWSDNDDFKGLTRRINGGYNGLTHRVAYRAKAKKAFGASINTAEEKISNSEIMPAAKIKIFQQRLKDLGYHMIGSIDGKIGTNTTAAISAFQHDNDLPITGKFDQKTEEILFEAEERSINFDRANGVPENSRIIKSSDGLIKTGLTALSLGSLSKVDDVISQAEIAKGYYDKAKGLLEPLIAVKDFVISNIGVSGCVMIVSAIVIFVAYKIKSARIDMHQKDKSS